MTWFISTAVSTVNSDTPQRATPGWKSPLQRCHDRSLVLVGGKPALIPAWVHLCAWRNPVERRHHPADGLAHLGDRCGHHLRPDRHDCDGERCGGIARVDFLVDGSVHASDTSAPYSASFDSTSVANGVHSMAARAFDPTGNSTESAVTVTVKNAVTSPGPALIASSSGDTGAGSASSVTLSRGVPDTGANRYVVVGVAWRASTVPPSRGCRTEGWP